MSAGWGCPHESEGKCGLVRGRPCDPGMKGCTLSGRFSFASSDKNRRPRRLRKSPATSGKKNPAEDPPD